MAKKKCLICGGMYSYCGTCYKDRFKPSWYQIFCSEECREIDQIISANTVGVLSDIDAKHQLEKLSLFGKEFHKEKMANKIEYLLNIDEPKDIKEEILDEENTDVELVDKDGKENEDTVEDKSKSDNSETVLDIEEELQEVKKSTRRKNSRSKKSDNDE